MSETKRKKDRTTIRFEESIHLAMKRFAVERDMAGEKSLRSIDDVVNHACKFWLSSGSPISDHGESLTAYSRFLDTATGGEVNHVRSAIAAALDRQPRRSNRTKTKTA